jgi:hypothetical protein
MRILVCSNGEIVLPLPLVEQVGAGPGDLFDVSVDETVGADGPRRVFLTPQKKAPDAGVVGEEIRTDVG